MSKVNLVNLQTVSIINPKMKNKKSSREPKNIHT